MTRLHRRCGVESLVSAYPCRRTTTRLEPPERTKMSAPFGLATVCALNVEGNYAHYLSDVIRSVMLGVSLSVHDNGTEAGLKHCLSSQA